MDSFEQQKISFLIKTFLRPACCERLVGSIQRYYPRSPILIADDSHVPLKSAENITVYPLAFNSGISKGRNYLVQKVLTPYFVLCDDDIIFTKHTKIEKLYDAIIKGFDLAGGSVKGHSGWFGIFDDNGNAQFHKKRGYYNGYPEYDFIQNFFLARTNTFRKKNLMWPEEKKVREHQQFFLNISGSVKITYIPQVKCNHKKRCLVDKRNGADLKEKYKKYRYKWRY